jgi:hypothetical protein
MMANRSAKDLGPSPSDVTMALAMSAAVDGCSIMWCPSAIDRWSYVLGAPSPISISFGKKRTRRLKNNTRTSAADRRDVKG